jgi:hypothetical protein
MNFYEDDIVDEVYRHRKELLEEYGGIEGLHKHMAEELPLLIKQGWKFVSVEEVAARNKQQAIMT